MFKPKPVDTAKATENSLLIITNLFFFNLDQGRLLCLKWTVQPKVTICALLHARSTDKADVGSWPSDISILPVFYKFHSTSFSLVHA